MAKILLVEDNEMNRDMLSRRLQRRGYEVVVAVDGEQGVAMARAEGPALVLMDMSLPGIDGWEATRQLKADAATRGTPVIALTAHAMAGDREKSLAAGCDDFDTKPVDFERLLGKIQALLAAEPRAGEQPVRARAAPARAPHAAQPHHRLRRDAARGDGHGRGAERRRPSGHRGRRQARADRRQPAPGSARARMPRRWTCPRLGADVSAPLSRILASAVSLAPGAGTAAPDLARIAAPPAAWPRCSGSPGPGERRAPRRTRRRAPDGDDPRGTVLVVDDDEGNRDLLGRRLAREGYAVRTARRRRRGAGRGGVRRPSISCSSTS